MIINSHAVGMAVAQPLSFEIDFVRNLISGSATWYFVIILEFLLPAIFEIKVHVKQFRQYAESVGVKSGGVDPRIKIT